MKRSEINNEMRRAIAFFRKNKFNLPEWAFWSPKQWTKKENNCDEIRKCGLGWDISDFGSGNFKKCGLLLFTIRNGCANSGIAKTYAEKIMIVLEKQLTPTHYHREKMEDIINRGGAILVMKLWKTGRNNELSKQNFTVQIDGVTTQMRSGSNIRLKPGQSITLGPFVYHSFWAERGSCLVGEVSNVNDDSADNHFHESVGRFPEIEEDEAPLYLLCNEYPPAKKLSQ